MPFIRRIVLNIIFADILIRSRDRQYDMDEKGGIRGIKRYRLAIRGISSPCKLREGGRLYAFENENHDYDLNRNGHPVASI